MSLKRKIELILILSTPIITTVASATFIYYFDHYYQPEFRHEL